MSAGPISGYWIHIYEIIYEFIMNSSIIQCYQEYHEIMAEILQINSHKIMAEFINLKLIWIQLQNCFSEGTIFTNPKY